MLTVSLLFFAGWIVYFTGTFEHVALAQDPPSKRFKFAARRQSTTEDGTTTNGTKETDLNLYILEQNTLSENTNAMEY